MNLKSHRKAILLAILFLFWIMIYYIIKSFQLVNNLNINELSKYKKIIYNQSLIRDFSLKTWNMWRRGARDIKEAVSNNLRVEWDINPRNKRQFGNIRKLGIDRSRDVVDDDVDDVDFWQTDPAFVSTNSCWNARLIAP